MLTRLPAPASSLSLTSAARRRGLGALLAGTFLMWGGFFMVVPLISVHFVDGLGWSAASVGLVLAVRQLTQQGLTLVGGALADRFGARTLILAGLLVRSVGFASLALATTFWGLMATTVLAALGGALFEAPRSAAIAALADSASRTRLYALTGVLGNVGMTLGILAGTLLLRVDFAVVALVAGSVYTVTFLVTFSFLPSVKTANESGSLTAGLGLALRDRPFVVYTALAMGYFFMTTQLSLSLPLEARRLGGSGDAVGYVFSLNALMSVALQYPLARLTERRLRPLVTFSLGTALMAAGLGLIALARGIEGLLGCVALFSLGGVIAAPSQQTATARLANPRALGSYFGVGALSIAFGGGLGNLAGGVLHDAGEALGLPALPWLVFAAVGATAALSLTALDRRLEARRISAGPARS